MRTLFILLCATLLYANSKITPELTVYDTSYGVEYSFETTLPDEKLYQIFFDYNHVKNYMNKTILTINLLEQHESTNQINFHYNYLIAHLDMQIQRTIDENDREVEFLMKKYYRSGKILPNVQFTTGHYAIREVNGKKMIHYLQSAGMDKEIGPIYEKMIIRETRNYLKHLIAYVREQEEAYKLASNN